MNLIYPPMFAVLINKESGKTITGHMVASRDYPFKVPNKQGDLCFAKQFKFQPADGSPAYWTDPFPMKPKRTVPSFN